jgi:hypothetical protein
MYDFDVYTDAPNQSSVRLSITGVAMAADDPTREAGRLADRPLE